jgi:hypothetical protein
MVVSVPVKMNIELGRALRSVIQRNARGAERRHSWQINYYVKKAFAHVDAGGGLSHEPSDTLDDNDGKMTPYFPEALWNRIETMADELAVSRSALVRALIYTGLALEEADG